MARPKRKKIQFTEESLNNLFQEIYDDNHNIKAQITRLFTKWETRIKEDGNIAAIGDQVVKLIIAQGKNADQKLMILKYLKEVVFVDKNPNNSKSIVGKNVSLEKEENVGTDRRLELLSFVQEQKELVEKEQQQKENNK